MWDNPWTCAQVGGVADLIHAEDHAEALFGLSLDSLVGRLVAALKEGVRPVRPRFQANHNEQVRALAHSATGVLSRLWDLVNRR